MSELIQNSYADLTNSKLKLDEDTFKNQSESVESVLSTSSETFESILPETDGIKLEDLNIADDDVSTPASNISFETLESSDPDPSETASLVKYYELEDELDLEKNLKFLKNSDSFATKRIQQDFREFLSADLDGIWVTQTDDLFMWSISICGPLDSPFEEKICEAIVLFSENHPYSPPKVTFTSPIFHPNIFPTGELCADGLLQENWSPCITMWSLLMSIQYLLGDPSVAIPANEIASTFFTQSFSDYCKIVREPEIHVESSTDKKNAGTPENSE